MVLPFGDRETRFQIAGFQGDCGGITIEILV